MGNEIKPKVSVCVVCYNQEKYIAQCLQSLVDQVTDFPFEVIVADDASTDNTVKIIMEYSRTHPSIIKPVFRKQNVGLSINYIAAHKIARGKYVAHMDGDDFAKPTKLQRQHDILEQNQQVNIVGHQCDILRGSTIMEAPFSSLKSNSTFDINFLIENHAIFPHSSLMYRGNDNKEVWDESEKLLDLIIYLRLCGHGLAYYISDSLGVYRSGVGVDTKNYSIGFWRMVSKQAEISGVSQASISKYKATALIKDAYGHYRMGAIFLAISNVLMAFFSNPRRSTLLVIEILRNLARNSFYKQGSKNTGSKKIMIFLPSLRGGGAERIMVTLANAFAARGFQVDLVLATAKGPYLKDVSAAVRVVDLQAGRVIKALFPLVRYLRRERPVALLSAMGHANVVALLARKLARVPVRVAVSEHGFISGEATLAQGFAARLNFWLIPWLYRKADGICTVSKAAAQDLAAFTKLPQQRVQAIYNPFDLAKIVDLATQPLEHTWLAAGQPPLILAVGRMNEAKDFFVLLRAFTQLRQQRPVRLMILGEGELRPALEAQAKALGLGADDVAMPGFVDNPYAWLARCSLFVLSSRREGLPGALIEAMACGAPIVSTNCLSGPEEILEDGRWGKLVPVGDVDALAQAMAATLDTPKSQLPDVRMRAADFEQSRAVGSYLNMLLNHSAQSI